MSLAFPIHSDPNCPNTGLQAVEFSSLVPCDVSDAGLPLIEPELNFPFPLPLPPLGCFEPSLSVNFQRDDQAPASFHGSVTFRDSDFCQPVFNLNLNLPPCEGVGFVASTQVTVGAAADASLSVEELGDCQFGLGLDLTLPGCPDFTAGSVNIIRGSLDGGVLTVTQVDSEGICAATFDLDLDIACNPPALNVVFTRESLEPASLFGSVDYVGGDPCQPIIDLNLNLPPCEGIEFTASTQVNVGTEAAASLSVEDLGNCQFGLGLDLTLPGCPDLFAGDVTIDYGEVLGAEIVIDQPSDAPTCQASIGLNLHLVCPPVEIGTNVLLNQPDPSLVVIEPIGSGRPLLVVADDPINTETLFRLSLDSYDYVEPSEIVACRMTFLSGAVNEGLTRLVLAYNASSELLSAESFPSIPAPGDSFEVVCPDPADCDHPFVLDLNLPCGSIDIGIALDTRASSEYAQIIEAPGGEYQSTVLADPSNTEHRFMTSLEGIVDADVRGCQLIFGPGAVNASERRMVIAYDADLNSTVTTVAFPSIPAGGDEFTIQCPDADRCQEAFLLDFGLPLVCTSLELGSISAVYGSDSLPDLLVQVEPLPSDCGNLLDLNLTIPCTPINVVAEYEELSSGASVEFYASEEVVDPDSCLKELRIHLGLPPSGGGGGGSMSSLDYRKTTFPIRILSVAGNAWPRAYTGVMWINGSALGPVMPVLNRGELTYPQPNTSWGNTPSPFAVDDVVHGTWNPATDAYEFWQQRIANTDLC